MKDKKVRPYHGQWVYLGCGYQALSAIILPILFLMMWGCAGWLLRNAPTPGGIMMAVTAIGGGGIIAAYIWEIRDRLYSWGSFDANEVIILSLFRHRCALQYADVAQAGIRVYVYGDAYNPKSRRTYWIFLSEDKLRRSYARNMNKMPNRAWSVRVSFRQDLYRYLVDVLPEEKANMLRIGRLKMLKHPSHNQYMLEAWRQ